MKFCWHGCNAAAILVYLVSGAALVSGMIDRLYIGSPKAPQNLLIPMPSKEKFTPKQWPKEHPKAPESPYRLPTALKPIHYVVRLQPFINGNFSILGHVEIEMEVVEPTLNITINMHAITAFDGTITVMPSGGGTPVSVLSTSTDDVHQFFIVSLGEELQVGQNYMFSMDFEGLLDNNFYGFYRASYKNENGTSVYLALTQFEPVGARRAFPCFDEPSMKATFDITLGREDHMIALANTPVVETIPVEGQPGWSWVSYETTVVMSPYLLAFVVSDFASNTTTTSTGLPFGVWARPQKIVNGQYALDKGPDVLEFYETYFNIPYVMPKMDMLAAPLFAGAMENWGLVIYNEFTLLWDPDVDSLLEKQYIMTVIGHEIAHQWFGNLVTVAWWSNIWIQEGFAQYLQYLGTDFVEPTWNAADWILRDEQQLVFEVDSLDLLNHPIINDAESPLEIDAMFGLLTYNKGASLNRMQRNILTEATFVSGLINYLTSYQYGNAYQDNLFEHLTNAGYIDATLPYNMTMKQIMDTWTLQAGYPVITVNRTADGTSASVSQERFWTYHNDTNETWWVPISYTTQNNANFDNTQPTLWMSDTDLEITVDSLPSQDQWVIFNIQETFYYRVNYDDNNWNLLFQQLQTDPDAIHPLNRAQINDDYSDITRAGLLSYENALQMLTYLRKETELTPWVAALNNLDYVDTMLFRTEGQRAFRNYLLDLIMPLYEKVGFHASDDSEPQEQLKHILALAWACDLGHINCVQSAVQLYRAWMEYPEEKRIIHPNMKKTVYCTAIAEGGDEEWDFAWYKYLESEAITEKYRLLEAMGCSRDEAILQSYLEMAFNEDSDINKEDAKMVFVSVTKNSKNREVAWTFLKNNLDHIAKYIQDDHLLGDMIRVVAESFNTEEEMAQLKQFRRKLPSDVHSVFVKEAFSSTDRNIAWMERNYDVITLWLREHGYDN
ncbi:hypothetical protein SK128_013768 [Halocaridina rubra]|uniref:Aminopeptidase n=1 Tax=Halocaridina rubra TaxID=373956 RepID=A0AAN8ZTA4_HALRR